MKKVFSLRKLAYLVIIAMPLYLVKISLFGIPTNLFEILAMIVSGLFLIGAVSSKIEARGFSEYYLPIVLLLAGLSISAVYSKAYLTGLGIIKGWFVVPIIFSWASFNLFENKKNILLAIYVSSFIVSCLSMVYFFLGEMTFDGRLQAFYDSPNFLAMFLAPSILIGSFLFKENKYAYSITLLIMLFSFYLTRSYASWVAVFAAIALTVLIKKDFRIGKLIGAAVLILAVFIFLQRGTDKFNGLVRMEERSSLASRLMIWSSALKIGFDNPIIGIGPGNFQNKYLEYQKYFPPYLEWAVPEPHNLFLAFWLQSGIVGTIGFLWILFRWFRDWLKENGKKKEDYVCLAIMIYILIHGLVDTTYFKNDLAVVFWLVFFAAIKKHPFLTDKEMDVSDGR